MKASRFPLAFVASILAAGALCAQSGALADEQPDAAGKTSGSEKRASAEGALGRIDFPNSGAREAQADFLRGVLLLHNFEYEDAAQAFRSAQALDPDFVLAFWGEALTYSHPIWGEDDPDQARAVLERLAPSREERARIPATERERALLASVEELYGKGERMQRNRNYAKSLERARQRFPDDLEIASFHALSILGTSENGRDIPTYMRAAAVAEEVFMKNPEHPGALHYAIHAYDDPVHAHLGLRMARRYDKVAAAAAHALHMPSPHLRGARDVEGIGGGQHRVGQGGRRSPGGGRTSRSKPAAITRCGGSPTAISSSASSRPRASWCSRWRRTTRRAAPSARART